MRPTLNRWTAEFRLHGPLLADPALGPDVRGAFCTRGRGRDRAQRPRAASQLAVQACEGAPVADCHAGRRQIRLRNRLPRLRPARRCPTTKTGCGCSGASRSPRKSRSPSGPIGGLCRITHPGLPGTVGDVKSPLRDRASDRIHHWVRSDLPV
jgi:hypothetical protein